MATRIGGKEMKKTKVYVLIHEWAIDYEKDLEIQVFGSKRKALKEFKMILNEIKDLWDDEKTSKIINLKDGSATFWTEGEFNTSHEELNIYEKEVK